MLRSCWRQGPAAPTAEIVRDLQQDTLVDYRYTQTILRRLVKKGYLQVERQSARRNVWTSTLAPREVLAQEVRIFVDLVVGLEPENIQLIRDALDELESLGPYVAFDENSLPRALRVQLIEFVEGVIERKPYRWALAAALGLDHKALDEFSTLARSISALMNTGGDTLSAALKLLNTIEELLESGEAEKLSELAAIRQELEALSGS